MTGLGLSQAGQGLQILNTEDYIFEEAVGTPSQTSCETSIMWEVCSLEANPSQRERERQCLQHPQQFSQEVSS